MDSVEQLIIVCQMDWMEQMFGIVFSSRRGLTVPGAVGIAAYPEEGSWAPA